MKICTIKAKSLFNLLQINSTACFFNQMPYNRGMLEARRQPLLKRFPWKWFVALLVAALVLTWSLFTPPGVLGKADAVGYSVCHRIDVRSFHIGERQFPMCARCSGQFLGAMLALGYQGLIGKRRMGRPSWPVIALLAIFFLADAIDGLNSYLHLGPMMELFPNLPRLYEPTNTLRLLTGTGVGLLIGAALYPAFNSTVWRNPDPRPALGNWLSFGGLLLLALGLDGLLLLEIPWIMLPMAILSALATLTVLGMVYTIVVLMVIRKENRTDRAAQLAFPVIAALGLSILQIAVIDWLRYLLTGTWNGFNLG
jgi:uncharacterized membrane protein